MKAKSFLLLVVATLVVACHNNPSSIQPIQLTTEQQQMLLHQNDYALQLLQLASMDNANNIMLSPLGVSFVCSMAANGADDETCQQILDVLGFGDYSLYDANLYFSNMMENLPKIDKTTTIRLANGIWVNKEDVIVPSFAEACKQYYQAEVGQINLSDPASASIIDAWASKHTDGLIKKVANENNFNENLGMILANALYFKGKWNDEFKKTNTKKEPFHLKNGGTTDVEMMHAEFSTEYTFSSDYYNGYYDTDIEESNCRMLRLYYRGKGYCMDVLLPNEGITVEEMLEDMDGEQLTDITKNMGRAEVSIALPKFKLQYHRDLNKDMITLGMPKAFQAESFPNLVENRRLSIAALTQDTYIEVDESGTRAASVTLGWMTDAAEPICENFIVDRPFAYLIREVKNGSIIFMGIVNNPQ